MEGRDEFFIKGESLPTVFLRDFDVLTSKAHEEVDDSSDRLRVRSLTLVADEEITDHPRGNDVTLPCFLREVGKMLRDFRRQGFVLREFMYTNVNRVSFSSSL